jgi:hypothetical protein
MDVLERQWLAAYFCPTDSVIDIPTFVQTVASKRRMQWNRITYFPLFVSFSSSVTIRTVFKFEIMMMMMMGNNRETS